MRRDKDELDAVEDLAVLSLYAVGDVRWQLVLKKILLLARPHLHHHAVLLSEQILKPSDSSDAKLSQAGALKNKKNAFAYSSDYMAQRNKFLTVGCHHRFCFE